MQPLISIIFSYRNRDLDRVERCLNSLKDQTNKHFEVLFVDYGSDENVSKNIKEIVEKYEFAKYIFTDSRGTPWNRAKALNVGIRNAVGKYIMTTDIDLIFHPNFLGYIANNIENNIVFHAQCYYIPESFNNYENVFSNTSFEITNAESVLGICQIALKEKLLEINGFDEFYRIWGLEDHDLKDRLINVGLEYKLIPLTEAPLYHQWHPIVSDRNKSINPDGWYKTLKNYYDNNKTIKRNNDDWGKIIDTKERKALNIYNNIDEYDSTFSFDFPKLNSFVLFEKYFNELNSNEHLIIKFTEKHRPSHKKSMGSKIIDIINNSFKIFTKNHQIINTAINSSEYISAKEIRDFIYFFILYNENKIEDYYIDYDCYNINIIFVKK